MAATAWWTQAPEKKGIEGQFNMEVDRKVSGNVSNGYDVIISHISYIYNNNNNNYYYYY